MTNQATFDQIKYDNDPIIKRSQLTWSQIPLSNEKVVNKVVRSQLRQEDSLVIDLTGVTDKESEYFHIEEDSKVSRTTSDNTRLELEIFLVRDLRVIDRSVYNLFMFLGNIGGLSSILFSLCAFLMGIINFQFPENYLASQLFSSSAVDSNGNTVLDHKKQSSCKEFMLANLPRCCLIILGLRRSKNCRYSQFE